MIITDRNKLEAVCRDTSYEECLQMGIFDSLKASLEASTEPGVGLAAPQIGYNIRAVYIRYKQYELRMINPIIQDRIDPIVYANEGCLSCPGEHYNTDRFNYIIVKWYDYDEKKERRAELQSEMAVVIQHECDHLDGILMYRREHHANKTGRNDPCPCGSGKKYKKCCGK